MHLIGLLSQYLKMIFENLFRSFYLEYLWIVAIWVKLAGRHGFTFEIVLGRDTEDDGSSATIELNI